MVKEGGRVLVSEESDELVSGGKGEVIFGRIIAEFLSDLSTNQLYWQRQCPWQKRC